MKKIWLLSLVISFFLVACSSAPEKNISDESTNPDIQPNMMVERFLPSYIGDVHYDTLAAKAEEYYQDYLLTLSDDMYQLHYDQALWAEIIFADSTVNPSAQNPESPIAENDEFRWPVINSQKIKLEVLTNDSDPQGQLITIVDIDTTGTLGKVFFDDITQEIWYTPPAPDWTGVDFFRYWIVDTDGNPDDAFVKITITPNSA